MSRTSLADRVIAFLARGHARRVFARMMADSRAATATQDRLLLSLIRANAESGYGRAHGFGSIRNYEDFVERVRIGTYADFAPWVEQVKAGDIGAMFGGRQRIHMFAMSSGTVDGPKYIPVTDRFLAAQRAGWNAYGGKALQDHPGCFGRSILQITSPMDEEKTTAGFPCGAITGIMAATQKKIVRRHYVAPLCVAYIGDSFARYYTIMRLAIPANVSWIVTASPATVLKLVRIGDEQAESIIRDVRDGALDAALPIPAWVRDALESRLGPDPATAKRLEQIRARTGHLRPMDYWNLSFVSNWCGGTMGLYLRDYPSWFGEVPVRDIGLIATEGRMSIPVADGTPAGVLAVSSNFYEFIPAAERDSASPSVLRSHELTEGEDYFIVLTNAAGLYRYDICDCVRVVGYEGQAPIIEFLHKGEHVSSISGEKITERQVVLAFERASAEWGINESNFVLAPQWSDPPFYGLYLEAPGEPCAADLFKRLSAACDEQLQQLNIEYASKRSSGRLGPIEARPVKEGALKELDARRAARYRRANEQYKHQYLYTQPGDDEELSGSVVAVSGAGRSPTDRIGTAGK